MLLCCVSFICCSNGKSGEDEGLQPAMSMKILTSSASSVTLRVESVNASHYRILCAATNDESSRTARQVFDEGKTYTGNRIVIDGLSKLTTYTVFAVACNDKGDFGTLQSVKFTTEATDPTMYAWEQSRGGILSFSDLVLCYGGSSHRTPYRWDKQRFAPFVTYTDKQGKEHWLFDSFLAIEFQVTSSIDSKPYSYMVGLKLTSAAKPQWQELIDYWFDKDNGINALEEAVKEAAQRMGTPPSKRKVIFSFPNPVIYRLYDKTNESTVYWGELNGRELDFSVGKDRVDACKWFIDQVRRKFDEANYQYVELAGFYIISEDLTTPSYGWNNELKRSDEIIPPIAEYLNSLNECLCWIPYNRASGYNKWTDFGINYAYMQPNHFWDDKNEHPLPRFFSDIKANNLAMEFEFDEALLEGKPNCDVYKKRFREYISNAKSEGIYGKQPLSYYHGTNGFYDLWASPAEKDKELYHEFCQFVTGNPLRK